MRLPGDTNASTAALHFALNRLTQAQGANMIGPQLQFGHGQQLLDQYHRYSPMIANQLHQGASLAPFNPQPLAAPAPQPHPQAPQAQSAPMQGGRAAAGGQGGQSNQVKMTVTLPHHSPATSRLFQILMGGHGI
jgi:hypothetical protein